jgi:hypothetical protein
MDRIESFSRVLACCLPLLAAGCVEDEAGGGVAGVEVRASAAPQPNPEAVAYLRQVLGQYHAPYYYVYSDADAAGNHFFAWARPEGASGAEMDPRSMDHPRGNTTIRATFEANGLNWGGWYFMNGVQRGAATSPISTWGDSAGAGVDLRGATRLLFYARGAVGGEQVRFYALGVGRNGATGAPIAPYPDSSPEVTTGWVTLTTAWKQYAIDLRGRDLRYVLNGFAWVTEAVRNGGQGITFFIDDIRYERPRPTEPRFAVSYATLRPVTPFDRDQRNAAFTYDNAAVLLALLAVGDTARAHLVADALLRTQYRDSYYEDGRVRNAYRGGNIAIPPGWDVNGHVGAIPMPGWYEPAFGWHEDKFHASTHTGNVAWAMLALLAYYEASGRTVQPYLTAAMRMGNFVERCCRDTRGAGGYTGGYDGKEPSQTRLTYKATEHNIDLYPAFTRLHRLTGNAVWQQRAAHARTFVLAMWDSVDGKFWTGTGDDGVTLNRAVIPLDVQAWAVLALRDDRPRFDRALDYAERALRVGDGFDFNQDRDGVWYEGTAQMAAAYAVTGNDTRWSELLAALRLAQNPAGGVYASSRNGLTTGFNVALGQPWLYYRRVHIAPTAWLVLAAERANPFWIAGP